MTHRAQQPPVSARAEAGSDGEEAAAAAATVAEPDSESEPRKAKTGPESEPTGAKTGSGTDTAAADAKKSATPGKTAEAEAETGPGAETGPETGAESDSAPTDGSRPEADPGSAAAAKSRLPAFVRTMSATALDRPQQQAGPVGRPGKAVRAGVAVAGVLLVSVPFLVSRGNDDKGPRSSGAAAGTVLGGNEQEAPGQFGETRPDSDSPGKEEKNPGKADPRERPEKPVQKAPSSPLAKEKGESAARSVKQSGGSTTDSTKDQPAKTGSGVTLSAPVSLRSHLSGRCIAVPGGDFGDGTNLYVWDCDNGEAQQWRFASDGTIRIKDRCLDVAGADFSNGTPIQIARCNGGTAQKFALNSRHDVVNTVVGKCVDIKDNISGNGAWLQLWSCEGTDNQKWSV